MIKPTDQELEQFFAHSRASSRGTIEQIRALARGNRRLIESAADTSYTIGAQASFATAFIYGTLLIDNATYQGYNISFYGTMWGVGFGAATSYGALTITVPPNQLNGLKCDFQLSSATGGVTIQIWDSNNGYVANFTGGAIGPIVSVTGGSGSWTTT